MNVGTGDACTRGKSHIVVLGDLNIQPKDGMWAALVVTRFSSPRSTHLSTPQSPSIQRNIGVLDFRKEATRTLSLVGWPSYHCQSTRRSEPFLNTSAGRPST